MSDSDVHITFPSKKENLPFKVEKGEYNANQDLTNTTYKYLPDRRQYLKTVSTKADRSKNFTLGPSEFISISAAVGEFNKAVENANEVVVIEEGKLLKYKVAGKPYGSRKPEKLIERMNEGDAEEIARIEDEAKEKAYRTLQEWANAAPDSTLEAIIAEKGVSPFVALFVSVYGGDVGDYDVLNETHMKTVKLSDFVKTGMLLKTSQKTLQEIEALKRAETTETKKEKSDEDQPTNDGLGYLKAPPSFDGFTKPKERFV